MTIQEKIEKLSSLLPVTKQPPSRKGAQNDLARAVRASLTETQQTAVVIGEPNTTGWTPSMRALKSALAGRPFTLKVGYKRTMYLRDEAALDAELAKYTGDE